MLSDEIVIPEAPVEEKKTRVPTPYLEEIRAELAVPIILSVFPDNGMEMVAIAHCESRFNPNAFNSEEDAKMRGLTAHSSWGIFQINSPQFEGWNDILTNSLKAKEIFDTQGYGAWKTCSKKLGFI